MIRWLAMIVSAACLGIPRPGVGQPLPIESIRLPPGFEISLFARIPNARAMTLGSPGTVYVGSMRAGNVYGLKVRDGKVTSTHVIATGLSMPVGVAFRDGSLFVSEVSRILRFDGIEERLSNPPQPVPLPARFPSDIHHGWKFIAFGPDGYLYVPVGAPCNVCDADPSRYSNIMRMRPDGSDLQVFARGVRNSVGFDWHPETRELWFTDNGRDYLGDDLPSDELNHAPSAGMHFGFPYCHQGDTPDAEFGSRRPCSEFTAPAAKLGAHVAALGMRFYSGSMFPAEYRNQAFIALHGSWNRSRKVGYRIVRVDVTGKRPLRPEPFAEGWLQGEQAWGRPADVLVMPDGSLLVSDDQAGAIYRISYRR